MTEYIWGRVEDLGSSIGTYAVMTQDIPWELVKDRIKGNRVSVNMVDNLEKKGLERLVSEVPQVDTVIGIGGGICIDNAKYFAFRRKCAAVYIPTIVSVNAYTTSNVAMRENGVVNHFVTLQADKVVIDFGVIQSAPKRLNTSGVGDIYSCESALFDWELGHKTTGEWYDEQIVARSRDIVSKLISESDEIRNVTERGIKSLVNLHIETNVVQELAKGSRPESGSEHVYFFSLEQTTGKSFLHGEAVGTGIYIARRFQASDEEKCAKIMEGLGLFYRPQDQAIKMDEFVSAVMNMKKYASYDSYRKKLPFSILDSVKIERDDAVALWKALE